MSKYNFDKLKDRRHFESYKWDCNKEEISLSIADMDFPVMDEIKNAILKRSEQDSYGYSKVSEEYFKTYKNWFSNRYNAHFEIDECIFSLSIVASLDSIIKRITNEGDGVLLLTPIYNVFFNVIKNNNRTLIDCPLAYEDHRYSVDWDLLEEKIKVSKAIIFCNPHNPVGSIFNKEEINRIIDLCKKNDIYLLSDEIHCDIDYNQERYTSALSCDSYDKLITLLSPGKTFNVAGLHSSIIVIKDKDLREKIEKGIYEDDVGEPNYFSIDPVIAAYTHGEEYVFELNDYLSENREIVKEYISKKMSHLYLIDNKATYLLWVDISYYQKSSEVFANELRKEVGLIVCPGKIYGDDRFIRINIATSKDMLIDALERLHNYILKLENK